MTDHQDEEKPAVPFLTNEDELEQGASYIKPNIETKLPAHKRKECREIVLEIRKFGINQRQLLYLIYLLSLELEDLEIMNAVVKVVGENRDKIPVSNIILE